MLRSEVSVRKIESGDLNRVMEIYNQGIQDRIATLETDPKDQSYMETWYKDHRDRYAALVATLEGEIIGWASLNRYSHRCAYNGVAELSIYIDREYRGKGIGGILLEGLENTARENDFHKILLFAFITNKAGKKLYLKQGYQEVGVFKEQGKLDGKFIDILAMEKVL